MKKLLSFVSADNKMVNLTIEVRETETTKKDWETLQPVEKGFELSIMGDCGGCGGQIYDEFVPTPTQKKLVEFWKQYHLNDCCAGTKRQTEYLQKINFEKKDYNVCCNQLEMAGLLVDNGYKYGTGWLFKSFSMDELNTIIADIEKEEEQRVAELKTPNFDVNDDSKISDMRDIIVDKLNCDEEEANEVIAFMRSQYVDFKEIDGIEIDGNNLSFYGTDYYVGTEEQLRDIAREYLDRYLWVEAVQNDRTDLGFSDWVDYVIDMDGVGSVLNCYDGKTYEEKVDGTYYTICRQ